MRLERWVNFVTLCIMGHIDSPDGHGKSTTVIAQRGTLVCPAWNRKVKESKGNRVISHVTQSVRITAREKYEIVVHALLNPLTFPSLYE